MQSKGHQPRTGKAPVDPDGSVLFTNFSGFQGIKWHTDSNYPKSTLINYLVTQKADK